MTSLTDLELTPNQYAEVEQADPQLRDAWLAELDSKRSRIKTPAAWFLAAIRTGRMPDATSNPLETQQVRNAEAWIRNVGRLFTLDEQHLVDAALFDQWGLARNSDPKTRERLLEQWRQIASPGYPEDAGPPDHDWTP